VVARVDGDVTVKRLEKSSSPHKLRLLPENKAYKPICVDLRDQEFAIEGIAVGIVRLAL
jgi:repressor LexA